MQRPLRFKLSILLISVYLFSVTSCSEYGDEFAQLGNKRNNLNVGASANDILSDDYYIKLIIEIQYVTGYKPPAAVVENLEVMLNQFISKPKGITVIMSEIVAPGKSEYSNAELRALESNNRREFTDKNAIAIYILFLDGAFSTSNTLGVAYKNTSIAIFQKTINDFLKQSGDQRAHFLTSSVVNHEFGHLLGLVNEGSENQSDHQDMAHGHHCIVQNCLMNWRITELDVIFSNNIPNSFDAQCVADLRANGGK